MGFLTVPTVASSLTLPAASGASTGTFVVSFKMSRDSFKMLCFSFIRYIVSDCDAVASMFENHKYVNSPEDAVALALKAGIFFTLCNGP